MNAEPQELKRLKIDWMNLELALTPREDPQSQEFLDTETGEIHSVSNDVMRHVKRGKPAGAWLGPWQVEQIPIAEQILADETDRYASVPTTMQMDRYDCMLSFARRSDLGPVALLLQEALDGKGAFRRFKKQLAPLRLQSRWNEHEEQWFQRWAQRWLASLGIEAIWVDDGF